MVPILLSASEQEVAPPDQFCSKWYSNCTERPCEHGICIQYAKSFQCYCKPGFDGECCQFDIDECLSNPCQHEGICYNLINGFKCSCLREWKGKFCEMATRYSSCHSKSCEPQEVCVVDNGNVLCVRNKSQLTQCYDNPCFNRGDCYLFQGSPYCICRPGFAGSYCENQEDIIDASLYKVHEMTNVWVGIGALVTAFFVVAVVLLVCHCHTYSCQMKIPYRRYENEEQEHISRSGPGYNGADDTSIAFTECTPSMDSIAPLHVGCDTQKLMTKSV